MPTEQPTTIPTEQDTQFSLRVPESFHKTVKKLAVDLDMSAQDIYIEGARWYVKQHSKKSVQ